MGRGTRDCLNRRLEQDVRRVWFPSLQPWLTDTCEFWGYQFREGRDLVFFMLCCSPGQPGAWQMFATYFYLGP